MWVLIIAAWFVVAPTNQARALLVGVFPTARECLAAKRDLEKEAKETFAADVASFGLECAKVDTSTIPDKAQKPKS